MIYDYVVFIEGCYSGLKPEYNSIGVCSKKRIAWLYLNVDHLQLWYGYHTWDVTRSIGPLQVPVGGWHSAVKPDTR